MVAQRDFQGWGQAEVWECVRPILSPHFIRLLETRILYTLVFILVVLPRLTYCQSSQVTEMLTAVKKQFVSTQLQLKYYQAAILDWQFSEGMLSSQRLVLGEAGI